MFIKVKPIKPNIIGENLDTGPKKYVKFVPIQDKAKSRIAIPINSIPNKFTIYVYGFLILLFTELAVRYTGINNLIMLSYFTAPLIFIAIIYFLLIFNFSSENKIS